MSQITVSNVISSTATASDTTGTPGGPSDTIRVGLGIGIPTLILSLTGIIVAICIARYTTNKKNRSKCQLLTSINLHGNWDKPE